MNATIEDLMITPVLTGTPHQTVGHARKIMHENNVHALPIVDPDGQPQGILTSSDLVHQANDETPVASAMTRQVFTVPKYADVHVAARIMRNKKTHHVLVTHEKQLVGVLSSFDLLRLVEDHRFVMKNPPSENRRGGERGRAS